MERKPRLHKLLPFQTLGDGYGVQVQKRWGFRFGKWQYRTIAFTYAVEKHTAIQKARRGVKFGFAPQEKYRAGRFLR